MNSGGIAQPMPSVKGTCRALLVGVGDYPLPVGPYIVSKLEGPVKDVDRFERFLKDSEKSGFDPENVFALRDEEATERGIRVGISKLAIASKPEDMVLFYFSGHGWIPRDTDITYLLPHDYNELRYYEATCIDFSDMAKSIWRMKASKVVIILDACHSGGVKYKGTKEVGAGDLASCYLEAFRKSEGRALLLSCDESEVSWDTDKGGVFTTFLLEGLNGAADANDDGIVTFTELGTYLEKTVVEYTQNNFPSVQTPARRYHFGQVRGDIPMAIDRREINKREQEALRDERNMAIHQSSLGNVLQEFSLNVVKSAYDKALADEELTEHERRLLAEIDKLRVKQNQIKTYIRRARAIYEMCFGSFPIAEEPVQIKVDISTEVSPLPEIKGKDGARMVLIPAGEFQMGSEYDKNEKLHPVYLDAFYMDIYEVTNAQYARFLNEYGKNTDRAGHELLGIGSIYRLIEEAGGIYRPKVGYENHPVVVVTWHGAAAYAQFYGKRLPTEAQWEKAARGKLEGKKYPWSGNIDPTKANYNHDSSRGWELEDMLKYLKPVGGFPFNGYGLYDMAGNVWEWCADEYDSEYYSKSDRNNPKGPGAIIAFKNSDFTDVSTSSPRVGRGGSWDVSPYFLRAANRRRLEANSAYYDVGFRCAQDIVS